MLNLKRAEIPTRKAFGIRMCEYGAIDSEFAVFEADIGSSTSSILFGKKYPKRYFDMGIAELGMVAAAAGMASCGRSVFASSYSIFLSTRALEAVRTFVCYPNLNVKFLGSHGGLTAAIDGVTHQATEDIANIGTLPNMKLVVPCDTCSTRKLFDLAITTPGPFYVRLLRDAYYELYPENTEFLLGGSHVIRNGSDITIGTYGDMVFQALAAADNLAESGISAEVIDFYSIKPLDYTTLNASLRKTGKLFVLENHQRRNGLGYDIADYLVTHQYHIPYQHAGLNDVFAESGKYADILRKYRLDSFAVADEIKKMLLSDGCQRR